jgi:hypothetical protein
LDHLEEGSFWVDEFDHGLDVYLAGEKVGVDELAGRGEGTVVVDEAGDGAGNRGEGVAVHGGGIGPVLSLNKKSEI